jgi:hypothetical protein
MKIRAAELIEYAKSLDGQILRTISQRAEFEVEAYGDRLVFIPLSNVKSREVHESEIQRILDQYYESLSFMPSKYKNITWNASYLLAILKRLVDPTGKNSRLHLS